MQSLTLLLRQSLWEQAPQDDPQSATELRRRRLVSAVFLVVGTLLLAVSLRIEPGSAWFYPAALLLALVWATGGFASGPLHLGGQGGNAGRPIVQPVLIGLGLAAVFVVGALIVREIPWLADEVRNVLVYSEGDEPLLLLLVTVLTGIGEELFFRGGLYAAIPRHRVAVTTLTYAVATAASGNVMLAFAALVLGVVVGLERRASGGILAPVLTHVVWSVAMLYALPAILL